jgi:nucleoside phosphorylase
MGRSIQGQGFRYTGVLNRPPTLLSTAVNSLRAYYAAHGHTIAETIESILAQKKRLQRTHKRPDPTTDILYVSTKVHSDQYKSCDSVCGNEECDLIKRRPRDVEAGDDDPAIFYGLIASANQVMRDATIRDRLAREQDVLCFEMEAAGLMNHFPCLVVRGTSYP